MFVEYKEALETQVVKMSAALRQGCPWVLETRLFSGCAIGTAYRVLTGRDLNEELRSRYNDPDHFLPYTRDTLEGARLRAGQWWDEETKTDKRASSSSEEMT
jgi:hypothetical protein